MITIKGSITDRNEGEEFDTLKIRSTIIVGDKGKNIVSTIKCPQLPADLEVGTAVTIVIESDGTLYNRQTNEIQDAKIKP